MNILIIGGAGFIGSNLVDLLIIKGYKITVLDNLSTGKSFNKKANYIFGNSWDIDTIFRGVNFTKVFHFGEYSRIATSFDDRELVIKSNLYGTSKVIDYCLRTGAKLIYSGSSSKFGNNGEDEHLSPYAWTKSKNIELIKNYNKWFNLQYEICYFYNVYGKGHISKGKMATVIGVFEEQYKNNKPISVVSPGTQERCFTDVRDIVAGVEKASNKTLNFEWFLKADKDYKLIDVAKLFSDNIKLIPERKGERLGSFTLKNNTNINLGWYPKYNLEDYINEIK